MSEVFTVFYCWQSDTPSEHCRNLVREALDQAADAITRDDSVPFRFLIQADTEGEPGLCNIPATILKRLRESDAVVSDLTFVAATKAPKSKYCSNPNVLFELGYAFAQIGPERLICVMNEAHGPAAKQIFDLAHHRRPIRFRSPASGKNRARTVKTLAKSLEVALRSAAKLGLVGVVGGDDEIRHERQLSDIVSYRQSNYDQTPNSPRLRIMFRPKLFRQRWAGVRTLEKLLYDRGPLTEARDKYPPQVKGNAAMDWGAYNDLYGDPWSFTYSGQFWTEIEIGGRVDLKLSDRDMKLSPDPPSKNILRPGEWVMADYSLREISKVFQLARNLSTVFAETEELQFRLEATGLRGRWLDFHHWSDFGPSKAPGLRREFEVSAADIRNSWLQLFAKFGQDFCDLFCRDGREFRLDDMHSFTNAPGNVLVS